MKELSREQDALLKELFAERDAALPVRLAATAREARREAGAGALSAWKDLGALGAGLAAVLALVAVLLWPGQSIEPQAAPVVTAANPSAAQQTPLSPPADAADTPTFTVVRTTPDAVVIHSTVSTAVARHSAADWERPFEWLSDFSLMQLLARSEFAGQVRFDEAGHPTLNE